MSIWRSTNRTLFFFLCSRCLLAAALSSGAVLRPVNLLIFGSALLGLFSGRAALFAFTLAVPVLTGISVSALYQGVLAPCIVFSGLSIGIIVRAMFFKNFRRDRTYENASHYVDAISSEGIRGSRWLRFAVGVNEVLISSVLLSLISQLWHFRNSPGFREVLLYRAEFAYGDNMYFVTAAFIWLQGFFYFQMLLSVPERIARVDGRTDSSVVGVSTWMLPVFFVYTATIIGFFLLQCLFHIPEGWAGHGFQSPYEDISSFGSVAVTLLIFGAATSSSKRSARMMIDAILCSALLIVLAASWSRGAWLAAVTFVVVIALFRFSRRGITVVIIGVVAMLISVNKFADSAYWKHEAYLARIVALFRFENPENKDSGRLHIYEKAIGMIHRRPLVGHGIGSFYLTSVNYAPTNEDYPRRKTPDFAHNVFLQIAAEEGIPAAMLFALLTFAVVYRGVRSWIATKQLKLGQAGDSLFLLGATLSLAAYLQTQMTANSLNVYVSNQFLFWLLMAMVLSGSEIVASRKLGGTIV